MRGFGDCGDVLHFEGQRTGRFGEHDLGVVAKLAADVVGNKRIVVAHRHTQFLELILAEAAGGSVDRIRDPHVIDQAPGQ
jgi:hypothetical protein